MRVSVDGKLSIYINAVVDSIWCGHTSKAQGRKTLSAMNS